MAKQHIAVPKYVLERIQAALKRIEREFPDGYVIKELSTQEVGRKRRREWKFTIEVEHRSGGDDDDD